MKVLELFYYFYKKNTQITPLDLKMRFFFDIIFTQKCQKYRYNIILYKMYGINMNLSSDEYNNVSYKILYVYTL